MFTKLKSKLQAYLETLRAEARGEQRVGQPGERGRVFAEAKGEVSITAKVYRASEGKWYDLGKLK